jgi:MFS family permease
VTAGAMEAAAPGSRVESRVVYVAGLVQGLALVTFPAAGTIFTDPDEYDLSKSAYGAMFVPQAIAAIGASLLGAAWARRAGARRVYLVGLLANLLAMALLIVSSLVEQDGSLAYGLLLAATASLGVGFGLTVPALNTFTAAFHPDAVDRSVLVLNALLGLGTALAPVFVAIFVGLGFWWGLPVLVAALVAGVLAVSLRLPLRTEAPSPAAARPASRGLPSRFWLYAAFALLYGVCETVNGNWAQLDMTGLGASTTIASLALTAFWAMVTAGRILFAVVQRRFPARRAYHLLPFVLAVALVLISLLPDDAPALGVLAFGLAGLGCSALLPLTISLGQGELTAISASVAGGIIAFYQLGYGIAAFGVGPLESAGIDLPTIFGFAAIVAAVMGMLSFAVAGRRPEPASLHPRPAA